MVFDRNTVSEIAAATKLAADAVEQDDFETVSEPTEFWIVMGIAVVIATVLVVWALLI